jgi:hypothetical protein
MNKEFYENIIKTNVENIRVAKNKIKDLEGSVFVWQKDIEDAEKGLIKLNQPKVGDILNYQNIEHYLICQNSVKKKFFCIFVKCQHGMNACVVGPYEYDSLKELLEKMMFDPSKSDWSVIKNVYPS